MNKATMTILSAIIFTTLNLAGICLPAHAVELPAPPDKWWETISPGDSATFEITINTEPPMKTKLVIKILDIKGSKITYNTKAFTGSTLSQEQTQTTDVNVKKPGNTLPEDAVVTKIGEKVIKTGGQSFKCMEYHVKTYNSKTNICHSQELPVIFNSGYAIMETKSGSITSTIILKDYTGKRIVTE